MKKISRKVAVMLLATSASMCLHGAVSTKSELAARLNVIAVERMQSGDVKGAVLKLEEAVAVDPSCAEAVRNLSKLLILGGNLERAENLLNAGLKHHPDDPGMLVQMSQALALQGKTEPFRNVVDSIAKLADESIVVELSVLLLRQGSVECAEFAADRALERSGENATSWFNRGLVCEARGQKSDAIGYYKRAVSIKPGYVGALVNLGNAYDAAGDAAAALDAYEKAYAADSSNVEAQYNLGRVLVLQGKDFLRGLSLLRTASSGKGEAAEAARNMYGRLVAIANGGAGK